MNFASKEFAIFLPIVLAIYYLLKTRRWKFGFLLVASWGFYAAWNVKLLWVIIATSVVDYYAGVLIAAATTPQRKKMWLMVSIVSNLGFLAYFKYANFFVNNGWSLARWLGWTAMDPIVLNILLPLGISFHTFQGISYTIDVYRGEVKPVKSLTDFALLVAFFPQLVAGPIVRATDFLPQMETPPFPTAKQILDGLNLMIFGFLKKLLIADQLAYFVDPVYKQPWDYSAATQVWAAAAYACQVYCDFSGYSDIAIGCAKWFGFELPRNFAYPFMAGNIAEFWRRWHISLSTWLRDYLYFPLGGNRGGVLRTYFNLLLTMTLCGLWHGAAWTFVLWGFITGLLLGAHRVYDRAVRGKPAWAALRASTPVHLLGMVFTWWLFAVVLVVFRGQTWAGIGLMEMSMLNPFQATGAEHWIPVWVPLLVGLVLLENAIGTMFERGIAWNVSPALQACAYTAVVVVVLVFGVENSQAFIYFQF